MMHLFGYFAAAFIGVSLGLIGGGGSILTVPVLVYLFHIEPTLATSYSLFIVGSTSLIGATRNYFNKNVQIKTALLFGLSSVITVFLTRRWLVPAVPQHLFAVRGFVVTKSMATLVLFAVLMLAASISMIRGGAEDLSEIQADHKLGRLILYGIGIGLVTGLLGAGGGFLLIPTLVLILRLPVKEAVGTSLLIIAINSLIGFLGDIGHYATDWWLLLKVTVTAIGGVFIGISLGKKISGDKLKAGFGWFVLVMGIYILIKELYLH